MSNKNQQILCSVASCSFYNKDNRCTLEQIQVAPCGHIHSGAPEEETNCSSYKRKK
jgi:hypothetical protein